MNKDEDDCCKMMREAEIAIGAAVVKAKSARDAAIRAYGWKGTVPTYLCFADLSVGSVTQSFDAMKHARHEIEKRTHE